VSGSIREAYRAHARGAVGYYAEQGASYRNPHEDGVRAMVERYADRLGSGRILDLAAGSGEVTLALVGAGVALDRIDAHDPYTADAYRARVGRACGALSFEELPDRLEGRWSAVVCSMALHLCERSRLPLVALTLARRADALLVLTPHKRPEVRPSWGWALEDERYDAIERVRARLYRSTAAEGP
jgi:hypothetical protein